MNGEELECADRIRGLRKRLGLSQAEFAARTGFSASYVKKVESGSRPLSVKFLRAVCATFGVTADYVLYGELMTPEEAWGKIPSLPDGVKEELFEALLGYLAGREPGGL